MNRVMIVEDDPQLAAELVAGLERWGFRAESATHFDDILKDFARFDPQLVLLDVNLPSYDGFWWCARIREVSKVPVMFLSSRDAQMDIVMAVNAGADDYIAKPFSMTVLIAKIQAIMRRAYAWSNASGEFLAHNGLVVNLADSSAVCGERKAELTRNELKILSHLLTQNGRVVARDKLMELLWNDSVYVNDNTLTANITRLRAKLSDLGVPDFIQTRKGQGYIVP